MNLTLYHRPYCHLCEEMGAALAPIATELGLTVTRVDIETDAELEARYGLLIPVLVCDGSELCHYRLDEPAVRRFVAAKRATRSTR